MNLCPYTGDVTNMIIADSARGVNKNEVRHSLAS